MTTIELSDRFDLIADRVGSPYFTTAEKENFFNTAQFSIIDDILKTLGISGQHLTTPDIILLVTFFSVFYVMGVVSIIYGIRLLRLKGDLFGMLKVYVYTTIAGGVCLVSIILLPLSLIVAVATYILEGMIFLRAAEDEEFV